MLQFSSEPKADTHVRRQVDDGGGLFRRNAEVMMEEKQAGEGG